MDCQSIHNEIFNIAPNTEAVRALVNPKNRHKTLACLVSQNGNDQKVLEETNKVRAPKYASDHRDTLTDKKIPAGYKLIGVKGFKNTYVGDVLHVADFIIWNPPPGWLDISPEGEAKMEAARLEALRPHMNKSG